MNRAERRAKAQRGRVRMPEYVYTYSVMDVLMASSTAPLPEEKQRHQLKRIRDALHSIEAAQSPTSEDWWLCSNAVNMMETLLTQSDVLHDGKPLPGWWIDCEGDPVQVCDTQGLLSDAIDALALAGRRKFSHGTIRLDGRGLIAVRGIIEDYEQIISVLPERTIKHAHRLTERRVQDILRGVKQPHDVSIQRLESDERKAA